MSSYKCNLMGFEDIETTHLIGENQHYDDIIIEVSLYIKIINYLIFNISIMI
jgi:hypothetical protein